MLYDVKLDILLGHQILTLGRLLNKINKKGLTILGIGLQSYKLITQREKVDEF